MSRSQARKLKTQWVSSSGCVLEQGVLSPAVLADAGAYSVPIGPAGGPLSGSSLAGPAPSTVPVPAITTLTPNTAVKGGADLTMTVTGTNFTTNSVIFFNNGAEKTTYIDSTHLSTTVKPSLVQATPPFVAQVQVSNLIQKSNSLPFTFTATELLEGQTIDENGNIVNERVFPIGPFNLLRVEPIDTGGGTYVLDAGADIQLGDTIRIEATGSTPANGDYVVESVSTSGAEMFVIVASEVTTLIDAKGRITVLAAGV